MGGVMAGENARTGGEQGSGGQVALWAVGAVLFLLLAVRLPLAHRVGGAEFAGYLLGALTMTLAIACAIWAIVYVAARRGNRQPFLSPWILFVAAGVGLLANLGAAHDRYSATHARTEHVLGAQHTKVSKPVQICAQAAMD